ncbi:MAG: queuosine precursor transporter [Treponema sp.]|nr:queuosine precursor transporter [Treponema sp.]
MNELLLIITLLVSFGGTILFLKVFGKGGLYAWIGIATVFANIEVTIVVHAFGMDQTLGNTLFAATFLATDILSEIYGKKDAGKGVLAGIFTSLTFILLSFMWVHYIPAESDWASEFVHGLFSNTPRMLLSSLIAYVVSEFVDVSLYHAWWNLTEKKTGSHNKMLWLRNNGSTLISQFINIVIFNFGAFLGIYSFKELLAITASCYVIYVATSLLDTPFVYVARMIANPPVKSEEK